MDYKQKVAALQQQLEFWEVDSLLISQPIDLYYLTGLDVSAGHLLILPQETMLFLDGRYEEYGKAHSPFPVSIFSSDKNFLEMLLEWGHSLGRIGIDGDHESWNEVMALQRKVEEKGVGAIVPLPHPLRLLRAQKSPEEIERIRQAARLAERGLSHLVTLLKEGITEKQVALEFDSFLKKEGAEGPAFETIIAFGPHSSLPHHRPTDAPLKSGQVVLVDFGAAFHHYNSDMTRVFFWKRCAPKLEEIYQIVRQALAIGIESCHAGTEAATVDKAVRDYIAAQGYGPHFKHGLGHGVGLEVHEWPSFRTCTPLQPGMVLAVEPGIYLPGIGGVRIEDLVLIAEEGPPKVLGNYTKELLIL